MDSDSPLNEDCQFGPDLYQGETLCNEEDIDDHVTVLQRSKTINDGVNDRT